MGNRGKKISLSIKKRIVKMHQDDVAQRDIADALRVSLASVNNVIRLWENLKEETGRRGKKL